MNRKTAFALFLILLVGVFLRLRNLDKDLLWQDEAEVVIYAKQILSNGFPNEYYRGIPLYVSPLINETIDSEMYQYKQRDFRDTLPVYHPMADAYLTALSFFFLGTSTFAARLPFALLGIVSIFLVYKLGEFLYNEKVGLFASVLQVMNTLLILYERQDRYYSLSIFGFLATIYFSLKAFKTDSISYYVLSSISLVLLFYSQPIIAIIVFALLFFYNICTGDYKVFYKKNYLLSLTIILAFLIPYLIIIRPWNIEGLHISTTDIMEKLIISLFFLNGITYNIGFIPFCISAIFLLHRSSLSDKFIILSWLVYIAIALVMTPSLSFYPRLFIQMLPTFYITIASMMDFVYVSLKKLKLDYGLRLILISSLILFIAIFPYIFALRPKLDSPLFDFLNNRGIEGFDAWVKTNSAWTGNVISLLERENVSSEWVFTTYGNAPLLWYTNYRVQLIWPVKKEFLNSYKERFWVVVDPESDDDCKWFNFYINNAESICKDVNYQEVIKKCKDYELPDNVTVYRCN